MALDPYSENVRLTSGKWKEERDYWLEMYGDDVEMSGFAADGREDDSSGTEHRVAIVPFPEPLTHQLLQLCRQSDQGLYALLVSAVAYVLHRYSGERQLTIGIPAPSPAPAGALDADASGSGGLSAVKFRVDRQATFKSYLFSVHEVIRQSGKYRHIPFASIYRLLKRNKEISIPAFKTVVQLDGLHQSLADSSLQSDIVFRFERAENRLCGRIAYPSSRYTQAYVDGIGGHLIRFFEEALGRPEGLIDDIELLRPEELKRIRDGFNASETPYERAATIGELMDRRAEKHPDQPAISWKDKLISYGQLKELTDRLAAYMRSRGVQRNKIVAVMTDRSPDLIVALVAVLKAGGTYLPIDPALPRERIALMLEDSGAVLMLTPKEQVADAADYEGDIVDLSDASSYPALQSPLEKVSEPEDAAYLIYTSGSTGKPKGVLVPHRAIANFIAGMTSRIAFTEGKTIAAVTTSSFDIFLLETLLPLTQGMKVAIAGTEETNNPVLLSSWLADQAVEMFQTTPSRMQLLLNVDQGSRGMQRMTEIMLGGEAFPNELLQQLQERCKGAAIYNMYGPTETTIWSSVKEVTREDRVCLGPPIANTGIYIVDSAMRLMPIGAAGELCIGGDGVALGYWNREELTADRFLPNPFTGSGLMYRTGDLARWLPNGDMEFLGRMDHQVKVRGYRVELGEVESALLAAEGVEAAVCTAKKDNHGNDVICAYYVSVSRQSADLLRSRIAERLPDYMLPSFYIPLERLPYTPNGKLDRKLLPSPYDMDGSLLLSEPPSSEAEARVLEIWRSVLGIGSLGVTDDFFNAGGHSLNLLKLEVEMEKAGFRFAPELLYRSPTVRELLRRLEDDNAAALAVEPIRQAVAMPDTDLSGATTIRQVERLAPFNDIFYKECFYNALFPAVQYLESDILPILLNDAILYRFDQRNRHFQVVYKPSMEVDKLLAAHGIRMQSEAEGDAALLDRIRKSIRGNRPVILRADVYYSSTRADTYLTRHWPHAWLVFGFDDRSGKLAVLEHDRAENLTYRRRWVSYDDAVRCHNGYLEQFGTDEPVYYEFGKAADRREGASHAPGAAVNDMISRLLERQKEVYDGLNDLERFVGLIKRTLLAGHSIRAFPEELIDALTQIVNAKAMESYRLHRLYGSHAIEMPNLEAWKQVRARLAKAIFASRMDAGYAASLAAELDLAYEKERQFHDRLFERLAVDWTNEIRSGR